MKLTNEEVLMKIITDNVNLKIEIEGLKECLEEIKIHSSIIEEYTDPEKSDEAKMEYFTLDAISQEIIIDRAYNLSSTIVELIEDYLE